jgi:hypothetical protein
MKLRLSDATPSTAKTLRKLFISCVLFVCAVATAGAFEQTSSGSQTNPPPAPASSTPTPSDSKKTAGPTPTTPVVVISDPRQAQIVADSEKLLKLSQELKAEVAKSNKDTLSIAVIKKAEEVEKLAKTLKEEMNKSH